MPNTAVNVLAAMITPAVLISASGTLVLSTSNRLTRVVDRVRTLTAELEHGGSENSRRHGLVRAQLQRLSDRAVLLRAALTGLYLAIGLLVTTSVAVGILVLARWSLDWLVVVFALAGALQLLYSSSLLVREARLGVASTLEEVTYAKELAAASERPTPGA